MKTRTAAVPPITPRKSRGKRAALSPRAYPFPLQYRAEIDYEHKLSEAEKDWLSKFNNAEVAGDFRGWSQTEYPQEKRREIWRDRKAQRRDALAYVSENPLDRK